MHLEFGVSKMYNWIEELVIESGWEPKFTDHSNDGSAMLYGIPPKIGEGRVKPGKDKC